MHNCTCGWNPWERMALQRQQIYVLKYLFTVIAYSQRGGSSWDFPYVQIHTCTLYIYTCIISPDQLLTVD